jgi:hypothetical protein
LHIFWFLFVKPPPPPPPLNHAHVCHCVIIILILVVRDMEQLLVKFEREQAAEADAGAGADARGDLAERLRGLDLDDESQTEKILEALTAAERAQFADRACVGFVCLLACLFVGPRCLVVVGSVCVCVCVCVCL